MAKVTSGTVNTSSTTWEGYITTSFKLTWSAQQSIETNTSTINWSVATVQSPTGSGYTRGVYKRYVTVNGETSSSTTHITVTNGTEILSGQTSVQHNDDGTKKFSISIGVAVGQNNTYTCTGSGEFELTDIPRASTVSASVSSITLTSTEGNAFAYSVTSKSSSFYSLVRYDVNGVQSVDYPKGNFSGTRSYYFTNNELLTKMPTVTSGTLEIAVYTYSDSSYTQLIGRNDTHVSISIDTSQIKPTISLGSISLTSSPISGYAIAGYSKVQTTWTTRNTNTGATSATSYFSISTGSLTGTSSSSLSGTVYSNTVPSSGSDYTLYIYAYAKDSRGATSGTATTSIKVYGYKAPYVYLNAYRVSDSTSTTEDGAGQYAYVTFSSSVSSSINGQNSIQSVTCQYTGSKSGTATNGQHIELSDSQYLQFTITATDKVGGTSRAVETVSTARYPLDLYDDGNGNVGFGAGAVATAGAFNVGGMRMYVNDTAPVIAVKNEQYQIGQHISGDGSTRGVWDWGGDVASGRNNWVYYLNNNNSFFINGGADGVVNMNGILRVNTIYSPSIARFYDTSTVLREGTYAIGADTLYYTAPQDCVCVLTANITANSNGICTIKINGVTLADMQTHRQSEFMNIIPIYLAKGDGLEIYISSNSSSSYKIFGLKY